MDFQFIAKAFLENDYEAIIAKKTAPKIEPASTLPQAQDVTMSEAPPPPTTTAATTTIAEPSQDILNELDQPEPPVKMETEPAVPEAVPAENPEQNKENPVVTEQPVDTIKTEEATTKSNEQAPPATTGDELNFDSMLATDGTNTNEFDLNFNFGNDEVGDQNFLDGTNFLASGTSMAEGANNDQDPNSISSLLPGLESYAADNNAGGDFNLELQKLNDASDNQAGMNGNLGHDDIMAPGESSFDDLFLEKDNLDGDDNLLGGDGLMGLGELDDNWLN